MSGPKFKSGQKGWVVPDISLPVEARKRIGHKGGIARQLVDVNAEALKLRRFSWQTEDA